jgi:hypothetical protein
MADAPQVKKWGQQEKQLLAKLIKKAKVDFSCKNHLEYADQVRFKYYCKRDYWNFCRKFCNYAQEQELDDTVSGTHRKEQGIRNIMFLTLLLLIILTPGLLLFQSPERNQDKTSNDNANSTRTTMNNNGKDSNDTIKNTMAKSSDKSTASATMKKFAKKSSNKKLQGWRPSILTPPQEEAACHRHSLTLLH